MSPQAGWLLQEEVVPRLRSAIPRAVSYVGSEDAEELIQDATAMAARLLHNTELAKKKVTPGNIAYYTIQHMKSGRRSTGSSVADVLGIGTQLQGRTRLTSFDEAAASDTDNGEDIFSFGDVLSAEQETKRNLAWAIREFMGADILIEVRRSPQWKDNLSATKEKMHCRSERH